MASIPSIVTTAGVFGTLLLTSYLKNQGEMSIKGIDTKTFTPQVCPHSEIIASSRDCFLGVPDPMD